MADRTAIEWTDATWTPIRARRRDDGKAGWHCEHVSEGCRNCCYSETFSHRRLPNGGTGLAYKPGHRDDGEIVLDETMLLAPLHWKKPRRIFVCSMTDLFGDWVPDAMIDRIFAVMALAPQHTFQVLTKRPARMRAYVESRLLFGNIGGPAFEIALKYSGVTSGGVKTTYPIKAAIAREDALAQIYAKLPNVWLGVSAEDQAAADERVPELLATPAAVRFVSAEPLLGPIDFTRLSVTNVDGPRRFEDWLDALTGETTSKMTRGLVDVELPPLNWIIVGGESGSGARPMHPAWARSIRDQCAAAGVPFLFKQWGEWASAKGLPGHLRVGHVFDDGYQMIRIGKRRAGRLLDGVEHNGMPELRHG